jgi:hypothetical protein
MLSGKPGSHLNIANKTATTTHALLVTPFELDETYTKPRSRFEVLKAELFSRTGNEFTITLDNLGAGRHITVSDVVILYHD